MKSFDDWFDSIESNNYDDIICAMGDAFNAGAQSKQAEVDELREMVRRLVDNTVVAVDDALENQANDLIRGGSHES